MINKLDNIPTEKIDEILGKSLLFRELDGHALNIIKKEFSIIHLDKNEPLFIKGELSQFVYFIMNGSVEIILHKDGGTQLTQLKVLHPGNSISEISVLTKTNHSTSCFALEETILLKLEASTFFNILKEVPTLLKNIINKLSKLNQQITNASNYLEYYKPSLFKHSATTKKLIPIEWINKFQVLPLNFFGNILSMAMLDITNQTFYKEFYVKFPHIILKSYYIKEDEFTKLEKKIKYNYKNFVNLEEELDITNKDEEILTKTLNIKELLDHTSFFNNLNHKTKEQLISLFKPIEYPSRSIIFRPDNPSEKFYIIQYGIIELYKKAKNGAHLHICTLGPKDSMGEISLVTNSNHSLFARAVHDTKIFALDKSIFNQLLTVPDFSLSLTSTLANRLQTLNNREHINYYTDKITLKNIIDADLIPLEIVSEYKIVILKKEDKKLTLGIVNPESDIIYGVISRYLSEYQINLNVIDEMLFEQSEKILYKHHKKNTKKSPLVNIISETSKKIITPSEVNPAEYLRVLIQRGDLNRASDIHFEPAKHSMSIRYRIDGELIELSDRLSPDYGIQMVSRIKIIAEMDITEKRFPQDGQMVIETSDRKIMCRVSTIPSIYGEKVVLRLVKSKQSIIPLKALAPDRKIVKFLQEIIKYKQGVFLVTGPTGSGKTTSLYSMINELNNIKCNVITVEDPVEIQLSGLTQVEINEEINLSFEIILRNILRQDPDVIMIGEIRDAKSANIAFEAALTGHLVLSSLHANSTFDVLPRLQELGVSDTSIASGLIGVMGQRLIPGLCPHCKTSENITKNEIRLFKKFYPDEKHPKNMYHQKGCNICLHRGTMERLPVFEYWMQNNDTRNLILDKANINTLKQVIQNAQFESLIQYGSKLGIAGFTTLELVNSYLYGMD